MTEAIATKNNSELESGNNRNIENGTTITVLTSTDTDSSITITNPNSSNKAFFRILDELPEGVNVEFNGKKIPTCPLVLNHEIKASPIIANRLSPPSHVFF